jgi:branched-chain amino acid transport system substrate-binding protein
VVTRPKKEEKMKKKLLLIPLALLLAISLIAIGCPAPTPEEPTPPVPEVKTLPVGLLVCLTGWFSVMDIAACEETEILAEMINESGGITVQGQRYNIEIVPEDCKSTFDGVTAATTRLVYDKGVKFILGPSAMFVPASVPICEQNKILHIISFKTMQPGELGPEFPYTFLGLNGSLGIARAGMAAMKKFNPNAKTAIHITPDDGSIPYLAPLVEAAFSEYDITYVETIGYPNEMVDFSPVAAKAKSLDADLIFHVPGTPQAMGSILKALREIGDFRPYGGGVNLRAYEAVAMAGKEYATNFYSSSLDPNNPDNPPQLKELCNRCIAKYGEEAPLFFLHANPLAILVDVIEEAQSLDTTVVRDAFEKMPSVDTLYGPGVLCGEKTWGIKHEVAYPQCIQFVENGEMTFSGYFDAYVP